MTAFKHGDTLNLSHAHLSSDLTNKQTALKQKTLLDIQTRSQHHLSPLLTPSRLHVHMHTAIASTTLVQNQAWLVRNLSSSLLTMPVQATAIFCTHTHTKINKTYSSVGSTPPGWIFTTSNKNLVTHLESHVMLTQRVLKSWVQRYIKAIRNIQNRIKRQLFCSSSTNQAERRHFI